MGEPTKIRVKLGAIEIEYEGPSDFLKSELGDLLDAIAKITPQQPAQFAKPNSQAGGANTLDPDQSMQRDASERPNGQLSGRSDSTNTIATKISVTTGSDLAFAAAGNLALVKGKATFSRKELLDEMKSATTYYKDTYSSNLSALLKTLTKAGKVNLVAKDTYSLGQNGRAELEPKIA